MRPDFYIAAMGRSGSTLIANWLTHPGRQTLFCEPNFFTRNVSAKLISQCKDLKVQISQTDKTETDIALDRWLDNRFGDQFDGQKWGFKEVLCDLHERCLNELEPHFILVTVRNIRDIYLSFIEKHQIQRNENRFPPQWSYDYCRHESEQMVKFVHQLDDSGHKYIIVRYEDFITQPHKRAEVEETTGWQGGGDLTRHLSLFDRHFEARQHEGNLTSDIRKNVTRKLDKEYHVQADQLVTSCHAYQSRFGF
jgi:hypothetical protein